MDGRGNALRDTMGVRVTNAILPRVALTAPEDSSVHRVSEAIQFQWSMFKECEVVSMAAFGGG